jgi:4-amino-4-deoxy-L-arabinose transferase-like glycosyltransferase
MPDWLTSTLNALPAAVWIIAGVGLPWALVVLSRRDWHDRVMVTCLALAFGPAWLTAWMFVLGTLGQDINPAAGQTLNPMQTTVISHVGGTALLRADLILAGTLVITLVGWALVWWKMRRVPPVPRSERVSLAVDERLLIALIVAAVAARWVLTSYLPFGSWDPLWVYGYQARVYTLIGYIPADIGYYPQFLPLQYAYTQIVSAGGIDDHAARAVLPFLQVGSILAVYVLGTRLFDRRTGILAAALWVLYPHFGYWTRVGDLEIPLTFTFTAAAAFFLMAWVQPHDKTFLRRRYALIAGLLFGIAMWTKPTAGAFVWGVALLVAVEIARAWRHHNTVYDVLRDSWPRIEMALITGLASIPLGALWYARNVLMGHAAVNFPPAFWLTQAMRSGAEFGWPLLALAVLLAYLYFGPLRARPDWRGAVIGVVLVAAGVLPTIIEPGRMRLLEWAILTAGVVVLARTLWIYARANLSEDGWAALVKIGWAGLLALPYFVTWFYSYSYHYRLSFPIVPLMLLPTAVILARWFTIERIRAWTFPRKTVYLLLVAILALPGVAVVMYDESAGWAWLWPQVAARGETPRGGSLQGVVQTLQAYIDTHDEPPVVVAPGMQTLPFYFPLLDIRIVETPRRTEALGDATHFIMSQEALLAYAADGGGAPYQNQWLGSLRRENVTTYVAGYSDPTFFYDIYELHIAERFTLPAVEIPADGEVIFGDFARLVGHTVSDDELPTDGGLMLTLIWQGLDAAPEDYTIYVHLIDADDPDLPFTGADGPVAPWALSYYSTRFWEAGEHIIDWRTFSLQGVELPPGDDYRIRIGFYEVESGKRVPVTVDGQAAGDGYMLETVFSR